MEGTPATPPASSNYDMNNDGIVNYLDMDFFVPYLNTANSSLDFNNDGIVDVLDAVIVGGNSS